MHMVSGNLMTESAFQQMKATEVMQMKKCPFCGGEAVLKKDLYGMRYVKCDTHKNKCTVYPSTPPFKTDEEAIAAWNTRHSDEG